MKHLHSISKASIGDNNSIGDVINQYLGYLTGSIGAAIQQFINGILGQFKQEG